mgnify:CR=1 FL=1|tara:strand:- start:9047 stop:9457 length:411 start_codon:yes stop_codon:yes gene_type:complete
MIVGFTCGSFDLLHAGHILMLEECAADCDWLIVGLQIDPTIDRENKNKPIQSLDERLIQLKAVRYVDEVVTYNTEQDLYDFLFENRFCINYRMMGSDWKNKDFTGKDISFIANKFHIRTHNFSTTNLRKRIELNRC